MLENELAHYLSVLDSSAAACNRAEDRALYMAHFVEAARRFAAMSEPDPKTKLLALVEAETRAYGWAFLSGEPGIKAESAFQRFAAAVRKTQTN